MNKQGTIVRWEEARGFGFIRSPGAGAEVFFHVKDFRGGDQRPREGVTVVFEELHVGGKGPRAVAVRPVAGGTTAPGRQQHAGGNERRQDRHDPRAIGGRRPSEAQRLLGRGPRPDRPRRAASQPSGHDRSGYVVLPLMLAYAGVLLWAVSGRLLPWWILLASAGLNLVTFFWYWQDKYAAGTRQWRTPEKTLHAMSAAGGWGGAWLAQQILRHKSRKQEFLAVWWATVVLHCGGLAAWLWMAGKF